MRLEVCLSALGGASALGDRVGSGHFAGVAHVVRACRKEFGYQEYGLLVCVWVLRSLDLGSLGLGSFGLGSFGLGSLGLGGLRKNVEGYEDRRQELFKYTEIY